MSIMHYWVCVFQHGETAIHMAASGGHTEVISFLQSKGADIAALDKVTSIYLLLRLFCCSKIIFLIIRYQFWKYKYYIIIVVYSVYYVIELQRSAIFLLSRDFTFFSIFSIFSIHFFRQHLKDFSVGFRKAA